MKKIILILCLWLGAFTGWAGNDPIEYSCNESGPHTNQWTCLQPVSLVSYAVVGQTDIPVCMGEAITPPVVNAVFNGGQETRWITMDCAPYLNYQETNNVSYTASVSFDPMIPPAIWIPGTYYYTNILTVVSADGICDSFTTNLEVVTVTVSDCYGGQCSESDSTNRLGYWRFDTNTWVGEQGQLPLSWTNVQCVPSWNTNALRVDTNAVAWLRYRIVETDGLPNLNPQCGTVRFWFKPDWNSTTTNSGTGPQSEGRLIEMGDRAGNGWWGLILNTNGTQISFLTQSNSITTTNLIAANVCWASNEWHQVALTYCPTKSCLYLDGQAVITNGLGVTKYPNAADRANGFGLGSDNAGNRQARGVFDELETFNDPLDATSIQDNYQTALDLDSNDDGVSNIQENQRGTNPYVIHSPNGLNNHYKLQVFTPLK